MNLNCDQRQIRATHPAYNQGEDLRAASARDSGGLVLTHARLQNFKSFRDASFSLGQRNYLVGPNMAGKSNFLELFRFLKRVSFPQSGAWGLANAFTGGFSEYTWKGGDSNLIVISLEGVQEAEWSYEIHIIGDAMGSITVQEERFSIGSKELIANKNGTRSLCNSDGREVFRGIAPTRAALEFEVPEWEGSVLRESMRSTYFYQLIPTLMKQLNPAVAPPFLTEHGENLSSWLMHLQTRYENEFAKIQQVCRDVLPDLEALFTWPTPQSTVSVGSREGHLKRPISVWQMSDGELAFVALLSLIFGPPELGAGLYCVEEPEDHLHPRLIETLMELLRQVQGELGASNSAQVIATTHSPYLLDKVGLDEVIVVEKREGASVATYPRDKSHLRELLQSEELGLGDLYYSGSLQGG